MTRADTDGSRDARTSGPGIEVALVSGLSGAGRSTAAKVLEDLGWFVVDNLPPELIATMVDLGSRARGDVTRIAVDVSGDTVFPPIDPAIWAVESDEPCERGPKDSADSRFIVYVRRDR